MQSSDKVDIEYPTSWEYILFTKNKEELEDELSELLIGTKLIFSKKNGGYSSFKIEVNVADSEEKDDIFNKLKNFNSVKMVL